MGFKIQIFSITHKKAEMLYSTKKGTISKWIIFMLAHFATETEKENMFLNNKWMEVHIKCIKYDQL